MFVKGAQVLIVSSRREKTSGWERSISDAEKEKVVFEIAPQPRLSRSESKGVCGGASTARKQLEIALCQRSPHSDEGRGEVVVDEESSGSASSPCSTSLLFR